MNELIYYNINDFFIYIIASSFFSLSLLWILSYPSMNFILLKRNNKISFFLIWIIVSELFLIFFGWINSRLFMSIISEYVRPVGDFNGFELFKKEGFFYAYKNYLFYQGMFKWSVFYTSIYCFMLSLKKRDRGFVKKSESGSIISRIILIAVLIIITCFTSLLAMDSIIYNILEYVIHFH